MYDTQGLQWDYAIGGLPFLSAASRENPIIRSTAPFRKQQFDASDQVGEQSLDGWWLRSQMTFHGGAGQLYADPNASDSSYSPARYWKSRNVDPWTPGVVKLLPAVESISSTPIASISSNGQRAVGITNALDGIWEVDDSLVYTEDTTPPNNSTGILSIATDNVRYFYVGDDFINVGFVSDGLPLTPASVIEAYDTNGATDVTMAWVKERFVYADNTGVYEITSLPDFADIGTWVTQALPTPLWTSPGGNWTPVSISESNSAIYVAGRTIDSQSIILKFTVDPTTGAMPTLGSGTVAASLPYGEVVNDIFGYLGRFLAIGTDSGPRIATVDDNGDLQLGPTLFAGRTRTWAARGSFLFTSVHDSTVFDFSDDDDDGAVRIDLGTEFDNLRFACAGDLSIPGLAGAGVAGVGMIGNKLIIASGAGVHAQDDTAYQNEGYIQSSRIRFSTLEPKIYKLLRVRAAELEGDFSVAIVDDDGVRHDLVGYVAGQTPGREDVLIPSSLGPQDFVSIRLTLTSESPSFATTPTVGGWQIKAIPGQPRQRLISLPLLCFDVETMNDGTRVGYPGSARDRLLALEAVEREANTVTLQDFSGNDLVTVSIENIDFRQTSPPTKGGYAGWGGIITLTLRTVF